MCRAAYNEWARNASRSAAHALALWKRPTDALEAGEEDSESDHRLQREAEVAHREYGSREECAGPSHRPHVPGVRDLPEHGEERSVQSTPGKIENEAIPVPPGE